MRPVRFVVVNDVPRKITEPSPKGPLVRILLILTRSPAAGVPLNGMKLVWVHPFSYCSTNPYCWRKSIRITLDLSLRRSKMICFPSGKISKSLIRYSVSKFVS